MVFRAEQARVLYLSKAHQLFALHCTVRVQAIPLDYFCGLGGGTDFHIVFNLLLDSGSEVVLTTFYLILGCICGHPIMAVCLKYSFVGVVVVVFFAHACK
jgi:hypothetical protein